MFLNDNISEQHATLWFVFTQFLQPVTLMMLCILMSLDVVNEDETDNEANYQSNRSHTTHIFCFWGRNVTNIS